MEDLKLPIALVIAMVAQIAGGVWWVSKQAATIEDLKANVSQMSSRMAIEQTVNMRRDVERNKEEVKELWKSVDSLTAVMTRQVQLTGRISTLEREMQIFSRDHFRTLGHDPNAR